jgi:hypothetical protein
MQRLANQLAGMMEESDSITRLSRVGLPPLPHKLLANRDPLSFSAPLPSSPVTPTRLVHVRVYPFALLSRRLIDRPHLPPLPSAPRDRWIAWLRVGRKGGWEGKFNCNKTARGGGRKKKKKRRNSAWKCRPSSSYLMPGY